jgi:hypothetical protein
MRFRALLVTLFFAVLPLAVFAQQMRKGDDKQEAPPSIGTIVAGAPTNTDALSGVLLVKPEIPLGPDYVLEAYERDMTLVGQRMSAELTNIAGALRTGRITRAEAEYLIQENYQVALMQYQVFSALHDALAQDIARVSQQTRISPPTTRSDAAVVYTPTAVSGSGAQ